MKPLNLAYDAVEVELTREELRTLVHALMEVTLTNVIAKGEFEARLGVTRERADGMLNDLSQIWQALPQRARQGDRDQGG